MVKNINIEVRRMENIQVGNYIVAVDVEAKHRGMMDISFGKEIKSDMVAFINGLEGENPNHLSVKNVKYRNHD